MPYDLTYTWNLKIEQTSESNNNEKLTVDVPSAVKLRDACSLEGKP